MNVLNVFFISLVASSAGILMDRWFDRRGVVVYQHADQRGIFGRADPELAVCGSRV